MRNNITFYTVFGLLIFSGIKWASYKIEKDQTEKITTTNYFTEVAVLLKAGAKVSPSEIAGKNIVIYHWGDQCESCLPDLLEVSKMAKKHKNGTAFFMVARRKKATVDFFFNKVKFKPDFKILYQQLELSNYIYAISVYFNSKENIGTGGKNPIIMVISSTGKIKLFKMGRVQNVMSQIEKSLEN